MSETDKDRQETKQGFTERWAMRYGYTVIPEHIRDMLGKVYEEVESKKAEWQREAIEEMGFREMAKWWLDHYEGLEHLTEGSEKVTPETMYTISTILRRCFRRITQPSKEADHE